MALKKMFALALVLFLAAAVPVSAAPVMSGCSMTMSAGMQSSGCCPAGACECRFKASPERHLLGELPSVSSALFIGAGFLNALLPDFRAPLVLARVPAVSTSPPQRKFYDLYSQYRI